MFWIWGTGGTLDANASNHTLLWIRRRVYNPEGKCGGIYGMRCSPRARLRVQCVVFRHSDLTAICGTVGRTRRKARASRGTLPRYSRS